MNNKKSRDKVVAKIYQEGVLGVKREADENGFSFGGWEGCFDFLSENGTPEKMGKDIYSLAASAIRSYGLRHLIEKNARFSNLYLHSEDVDGVGTTGYFWILDPDENTIDVLINVRTPRHILVHGQGELPGQMIPAIPVYAAMKLCTIDLFGLEPDWAQMKKNGDDLRRSLEKEFFQNPEHPLLRFVVSVDAFRIPDNLYRGNETEGQSNLDDNPTILRVPHKDPRRSRIVLIDHSFYDLNQSRPSLLDGMD